MSKKLKENEKKIIKIPNNTKVFWCEKKKIIIIEGLLKKKSLRVHDLIKVCCTDQQIELMNHDLEKLSNYDRKKSRSLKKTMASLLKQLLVETTAPMYQKLKFVGVGYRAFPVENFESRLLLLRLGYSHPIYFKIPSNTNIFCLKFTQLFVYSHSYHQTTFTASKIRSCKTPEPYKGKGILYDNEKITLKEGKKV